MIRIRINQKKVSDVTSMNAKGWRVSVFRESKPENEMVTVERDAIKFVMSIMQVPRSHAELDWTGMTTMIQAVQIKKYIHGYFTDSKIFMDTGSGINGTICISEGKTVETTYAFFQSEELDQLKQEFDIKKITFPKDIRGYRFDKIIPWDEVSYEPGAKLTVPKFHTDGVYELIQDEDGRAAWQIGNATYVYEYERHVLTIPWEYNLKQIRELMRSLTE